MNSQPPIRQSCPPGTCTCRRDELLEAPGADVRILLLTRHEENRLLERLANVQSLEELERLQQRMFEQLGIRMSIAPGHNEVRSMRGIAIEFAEQPGNRLAPARCARFAGRVMSNLRPVAIDLRSLPWAVS